MKCNKKKCLTFSLFIYFVVTIVYFAITVVGYINTNISENHANSDYLITSVLPENREIVSVPISIIADNQLHNLYGDPFYLRTKLYDKFIKTVIRPIQLDLFSPDVLHYAIQKELRRSFVVHLGDALDLATTGEFDDFCDIMKDIPKGWVMAPGNHDVYFYGNYHPASSENNLSWQNASKHSGEPMTKDRFIRKYILALGKQEAFKKGAFESFFSETDTEQKVPLNKSIIDSNVRGGKDILKGINWNVVTNNPWQSFIVQQLDISHPDNNSVGVILIDTTQYAERPTLLPISSYNSGLTGDFQEDQATIIQEWIKSSPHTYWVLMGHHPIEHLTKSAQKKIFEWVKQEKILLYVSGHTHTGSFISHTIEDENKNLNTWLELNIGSIIDWPMVYRKFQIRQDKSTGTNKSSRLLLDSAQFSITNLIGDAPDNFPEDLKFSSHTLLEELSPLKTAISVRIEGLNTYKFIFDTFLTEKEFSGEEDWLPIKLNKDSLGSTNIEKSIHQKINDHISQIVKSALSDLTNADQQVLETKLTEITDLLMHLKQYDQKRWENISPDKYQEYLEFKVHLAIRASKNEFRKFPLTSDQYVLFPKKYNPK